MDASQRGCVLVCAIALISGSEDELLELARYALGRISSADEGWVARPHIALLRLAAGEAGVDVVQLQHSSCDPVLRLAAVRALRSGAVAKGDADRGLACLLKSRSTTDEIRHKAFGLLLQQFDARHAGLSDAKVWNGLELLPSLWHHLFFQ